MVQNYRLINRLTVFYRVNRNWNLYVYFGLNRPNIQPYVLLFFLNENEKSRWKFWILIYSFIAPDFEKPFFYYSTLEK